MSMRGSKSMRTNCDLVKNPDLRRKADARTDAVASSFPAGVARPALRALLSIGVTQLEQLTRVSEPELAQLHGMGPKAVGILRAALRAKGLDFKTTRTRR